MMNHLNGTNMFKTLTIGGDLAGTMGRDGATTETAFIALTQLEMEMYGLIHTYIAILMKIGLIKNAN